MRKLSEYRAKTRKTILLCGLVLAQAFSMTIYAQKSALKTPLKTQPKKISAVSSLPAVTMIDMPALKKLLKREGADAKPLLVNFWATWCDPCREEFPELVKINDDYRNKIDFITVSLDDAAIIKSDVPKFLLNMKAEMPAYLLNTDDEEAAISSVSKDWQGGLPFTVLINGRGAIAYTRQGKINASMVRAALDKVLTAASSQTANATTTGFK